MAPTSPPTRRIGTNIDTDTAPKKRRRGAARLSCAECRRLKLRCDRKVPCDSCVKRGCGAICPDGSLTTGKGNRFVLASTQELHEKISELATRVRELEDALRVEHAQLSESRHPLLTEELLKIKMPLEREVPSTANGDRGNGADGSRGAPGHGAGGGTNGVKEEQEEVVATFGSLSISQSGRTKYYGHVASSYHFLQNENLGDEQDDRLSGIETVLPPEILALGSAFPQSAGSPLGAGSPIGGHGDESERLRGLFWYLPNEQRAAEVREIYYERAAWMYNPIPREQLNEEVFSHFYIDSPTASSPSTAQTSPTGDSSAQSHRLALLFMVLAIGTLMDTNMPAYNLEAEKYHQLARAALFHQSLYDEPTLMAVQAVFLMSYYLFLADRHGTYSGSRWIVMGIAVKLAQSIGLHRDSTRWGMDDGSTQTRRETFWELYTYDSWQCCTFGRPPSFALAHVDAKFPYPADDPTGKRSFDTWKHKFSSECMSMVHDQAYGARTPSYQTILQLDRKMRAFPVPPILQIAGFGSTGDPVEKGSYVETVSLILQRHIVLAIRETNLLYMHRGFFARAISDCPKDPLGSPFGTSVIAAYRSAGSLVALVRNLDSQLPEPTERLWFLWTHLFSCAIVLGSIVTHCPSMSLAPSALVQLDSACELFSKVALTFRSEKVLNIMLTLRQKAHAALKEFRDGIAHPQAHGSSQFTRTTPESGSSSECDDELAKLGGQTRLISQKDKDSSKSPSPSLAILSPTTQNPIIPLPPLNPDVHPDVLTYLNTFTHRSAAPAAPVQESTQTNGMYSGRHSLNGYGSTEFQHSMQNGGLGNNRRLSHEITQSPTTPYGGMDQNVFTGSSSSASMQPATQGLGYFSVFDYAPANGDGGYVTSPMHINGSGHGTMGGFGHGSFVPTQDERTTPDGGIQTSWMDFVAQMSMST